MQVDLKHIDQEASGVSDLAVIKNGIDLHEFYRSVEWELLNVPAKKNEKFYTCCTEPYPDITFNITVRRKTLFHTVNLIVPCVAISFLTVLVFYLPSDSAEKIALCISILLSLTVFILLIAETIPPTSTVVPLIGKYLLFTMVLVTLSIIVTVVVLNVHFRSPSTNTMSPWIRKVFLTVLPSLLMMKRSNVDQDKNIKVIVRTCSGMEIRDSFSELPGAIRNNSIEDSTVNLGTNIHTQIAEEEKEQEAPAVSGKWYPTEVLKALDGLRFITEHVKEEDNTSNVRI